MEIFKNEGASQCNLNDITVRCTFYFIIVIYSTNIYATLSLPV